MAIGTLDRKAKASLWANVFAALVCGAVGFFELGALLVRANSATAIVIKGESQVTCDLTESTKVWTCSDGIGDYGLNEDAEVELRGPGAFRIRMLKTEVNDDGSCADYLEIGSEKYCSNVSGVQASLPKDIIVPADGVGNVLSVKWRTDGSGHSDGFEFTFHTCTKLPGGTGIYNTQTGSCFHDTTGTDACPSLGLLYVSNIACAQDCPVGWFANNNFCQKCPSGGLTAAPGATSSAECVSEEG